MVFLSIILWLAIVMGLAAASSALYGHYFDLPQFLTGPAVCEIEGGSCAILFRTKNASLLGVPNALLGVVLYLLLATGIFLAWPSWLLLPPATAALAMSIKLGYGLLKNHLQCRICWTGHIANATLWLALWVRLFAFGI